MAQQLLLAFDPPASTYSNFFAGRNVRVLTLLRERREQFVYLWGASGSGRSHLLAAAQTDDPALAIADDVDRLAPDAQIELFERFVDALQRGARMLCAGAMPPARLALREDLRTRLGQGIVAEVHALSDDERIAAFAAHANERGMRVPMDVLKYITVRVARDMGTQMAVLHALDRYSLEAHRPLTVALARDVLAQQSF